MVSRFTLRDKRVEEDFDGYRMYPEGLLVLSYADARSNVWLFYSGETQPGKGPGEGAGDEAGAFYSHYQSG